MRIAKAAATVLTATCLLAAGLTSVASSAAADSPPGTEGSFPLHVTNDSGQYSADQVYVTVVGQAPGGRWSYLTADGAVHPMDHRAATAPGHLTKNGIDYPAMSFTLADASTVAMPADFRGARVYLSLGSPMFLGVAPDDSGWAGPDLHNPADPNTDVLFDWYEYTYAYGDVPFGGNTTQVDMLGFPITARLQQAASGHDRTVGIEMSRDRLMSDYAAQVDPAFRSTQGTERIVAPRSAAEFAATGPDGDYLAAAIDRTWQEYRDKPFELTRLNQTFSGRVVGDDLEFTKDGAGPFVLHKPSTQDVLACSGALASDGMKVTELELGAEFCAAFNRGVAGDTADWYDPSTYYRNAESNQYAAFMHDVSIDHRAYGFAYDDVNSQSSVDILDNSAAPDQLTLTIEPMHG